MSAGQQDDYEVEDALTTEEELLLKYETMRDFFVQQVKALRETVLSVQKAAQEDLKAFTQTTEKNFREELQHNAERTRRQLQGDLHLLEENFKTVQQKVDAKVKAMEESVVNRMATVDGKLESVLSRVSAMEIEVCSMLGFSLDETPQNQNQNPSDINQPHISTPISCMPGHEEETSVDIRSPTQSPVEPTQGPTFTLTRRTASLPVQPSASSSLLSSMPGWAEEAEISVDFQSTGYQQQVGWTKRKLAKSLQDLQPDVAAKVKPHMSQKITRQEKLSKLQVAYFHYQTERLNINDTKGLCDKADAIKESGERDGVWSPGWSPRGTKDMQQFLVEKIKTTLKKRRRSEMVVEEEKRELKQKIN